MHRKTTTFLARSTTIFVLFASAVVGSACAQNKSPDTGAATPAGAAATTPADKKPAGTAWDEAPGYDLYVGKTEDAAARFFQSPDFQKILIYPGTGETAYVIALKAKTASSVPKTAVTATADAALIDAAAAMKSLGAATQKDADMSFKDGSADLRLTPEPPLIGETTVEALLKKKGDYAAHAQMYKPKSAAMSLIKSVSQPIEIKVFFGTWCSYCKKWLPTFIKTIQVAGNPNIHVQYFGVDEAMSQPEAQLTQYGISRTPTFVVIKNGKEIGRIVEEPKDSVEEDLALILLGR